MYLHLARDVEVTFHFNLTIDKLAPFLVGTDNLFGTQPLYAKDRTAPVPDAVRHFDLWVMLAALVACLPVFLTGREIARWEGALFLLYYAAYTAYLILQSQAHAALPAFSRAMLGFIVPLTLVTIVVSLLRRPS